MSDGKGVWGASPPGFFCVPFLSFNLDIFRFLSSLDNSCDSDHMI